MSQGPFCTPTWGWAWQAAACGPHPGLSYFLGFLGRGGEGAGKAVDPPNLGGCTRYRPNCCPVRALKKLKKVSNGSEDEPVFKFGNNSFFTSKKLNGYIQSFLSPHLGEDAKFYFCHSFRGALPSALAAIPNMDNDPSIKKWGRWNSDAFERYVRLSHIAKSELFKKFVLALNCVSK